MSVQRLFGEFSRIFSPRVRRAAAVALLAAAVPVAQAGDGSGLAKAIAQSIAALQQASQQTQAAIQKISQQTQAAFGKIIGQTGGTLGGTLQQSFDNLALVLKESNPSYLDPTPGTTAVNGSLTWQGAQRTYVLIRPAQPIQNAPALVLLHARGISPQTMANLSRAGRLAHDYGVYVYLPLAQNGAWNEDPSSMSSTDDVGFLSALIDQGVQQDHIDAQRVYFAGYSSGGFMAERMACQASSKVAGFVAVAATLRNSLMSVCAPQHGMPAAFMDGTSDLVVPYNGEPSVQSASAAAVYWATVNGCLPVTQMQTQALPQQSSDGTSVAVTSFTACAPDAAARLYTINGGGHTWPGSPYSLYTSYLGRTTQNLDATVELWKFLTPYSLN